MSGDCLFVYYESIKMTVWSPQCVFICSRIKKGRRPKGRKNVTLKAGPTTRNFFFLHRSSLRISVEIEDMEESDGVSSTQTAAGSDTAEEERAIRAMQFVTTLSFVRAVKTRARQQGGGLP